MTLEFDQGSFRDPRGRIFYRDGEVLRHIAASAASDFDLYMESGLGPALVERGWAVSSEEVSDAPAADGDRIVRHSRIPFISYPYEWSFSLLKAAALHHIDTHLLALDHGMTLSDGSAYNIQFDGVQPVFIDILSFIRYTDGDHWKGHQQFCDHFLHPLLLASGTGVPFQSRLRGDTEGIGASELLRLLPLWRKYSPRTLFNILLPERLSSAGGKKNARPASYRPLPKSGLVFLLRHLRKWIEGLGVDFGKTTWSDYYSASNNYDDRETEQKRAVVAEFCRTCRPRMLWDIGCNTGTYSEIALSSGAGHVIGFDFDTAALEAAHHRAKEKSLAFTPLFQDSANPSPAQGWSGAERRSLGERRNADAILALALEHHLAIGRNVPLAMVVDWLIGLAPTGLIEFIPKGDSNLDLLLRNREDIFADYTEANFHALISERARVVRKDVVSGSGRTLFWYDRTGSR